MMQNDKRSRYLSLLPVVFALAWPTMLEELMQTAVQYIDTAMVGRLGTDATAAVGSTTTVNWLVGTTIYAFAIGFLACISQALGAGERDRARRLSAQSVLAVLVSGGFFTVVTVCLSSRVPVWMQVEPHLRPMAARYFRIVYAPMLFRAASVIFGTVLRAAGDTKTPMRVGVLMNLVNVVLNFFLIYGSRTVRVFGAAIPVWGAGLGVTGAALASASSFVLGGTVITVALFRHKLVSPRGFPVLPDKTLLRPLLRIAVPNMLQRFTTSLGYVVFASMINALGDLSTAAHTVANTVESAFYIPGYGMQAAAATLTGNAIGRKDRQGVKDLGVVINLLEVGMMVISGALLFAFAPQMVRLFIRDEAVVSMGSTVLRMVALSEPVYGVSIVLEGMLQGAGQTRAPFLFNVIGMWGVRILGTWICTRLLGMGLISAWACMIAHNILLCLLFALFCRFGRWNPTVPPRQKKTRPAAAS